MAYIQFQQKCFMDLILSNSSDEPIYRQIVSQIKEQIVSGELSAGVALPSMRFMFLRSSCWNLFRLNYLNYNAVFPDLSSRRERHFCSFLQYYPC